MNRAKPLARTALSALKFITPSSSYTYSPTSLLFSTRRAAQSRLVSTTTPTKMASQLIELAKNRRSYYPLSKDLTIQPDKIQEIVKTLLQEVPSSFNSQSNRVIVLFGAEHEKLWDITSEILKPIVPADQWEATAGKMGMFKGAAGTVLFFEDQDVVNGMQEKFALYADRFPTWAAHSDAMLQFAVWTALEAEGLGANLQHYNPLVDNRVTAEWGVPLSWKLQAQLVFGGRTGAAGDKTYAPVETKFKSFGA